MADVIKSAANDKIKKLRALQESAKERKRTGLFAAEGLKIFSEAPEEAVEEIFISEGFAGKHPELASNEKTRVVEDGLFKRVCATNTPQGIITVFRQPEWGTEALIRKGTLFAALENVQDPGNVGGIIRTAEGAGADGVILFAGCADPFSPKTVRSTMGSVFRVPIVSVPDMSRTIAAMKNEGVKICAAHLSGEIYYDEYDYPGKMAILIGSEGSGLSEELTKEADVLLKIPMEGKLESLNAAVAASVILYAAHSKRKRSIFDD